MVKRWVRLLFAVMALAGAFLPAQVAACGGFFCTTVPVDQSGERVIFTIDEGTISTYVQINYVGRAEDFAWVLPVPSVPTIETAEMSTFTDLDRLTRPQYIPPRPPSCLSPRFAMPSAASAREDNSTTVLASGEVGPFGYHVVQSPDPQDLVRWLRDNGYQITPEMEPLVKLYTDEGLVFLAMRLRQGQGATDIVPVKLRYESRLPTVPLRLTAVAATPDMPVLVWVFGSDKVAPLNFAPIEIADSEVRFLPNGRNDYTQVVSRAVDQAGGRAFVTEFAGPTAAVNQPSDRALQGLLQQYPYLTRLYTRISPEEMSADPVFDVAPGLPNVSNVHNLSERPTPWTCNDDFGTWKNVASSGPPPGIMEGQRYLQRFGQDGVPKGLAMFGIIGVSALVLVRRRSGLAAAGNGMKHARRLAFGSVELTPRTTALLALETVLFQAFHELEHIVQVFQRMALGIGNGAGMLGSVFDIEPVHMVYNAGFLVLLGLVTAGALRHRDAVPMRRQLVLRLLIGGYAFQAFHTLEHVVKMVQYFQTGMNGTPGIFGYWVPVVYLHLGYNTLAFIPILAAFFLGGFHRAAWAALAPALRVGTVRSGLAS